MANINDYLLNIQELTQQNLDILKAINDSFFTKSSHITSKIGDSQYVIPSFVSLENKINSIQETLNNIVSAPSSGEAYFNMDGNTRSITVNSYDHTPAPITLTPSDQYIVNTSNIFKDMMDPAPCMRFSLAQVNDDLTSAYVKKVILRNNDLINTVKERTGITEESPVSNISYSDIVKMCAIYRKGTDYVEYDKTYSMPVKTSYGYGVYAIKSIISDTIDENLDEYIKISIRNDIEQGNLSYTAFDGTIQIPLAVGDYLTTFDGSAKLQISEIDNTSNQMTLHVLNGEYINMVPSESGEAYDLSKLKFFSPHDFDKDKYIDVPLEEDQYVFIAIAPMNDRMKIRAPWGTGVFIDVYNLKNGNDTFKDYYTNVKNIGDTLNEISGMMPKSMSHMSEYQFNTLTGSKPVINQDNLMVDHINKHLDDSASVQHIRQLYAQKMQYISELNTIQNDINKLNSQLATISYDDTTGIRAIYEARLKEYNAKKTDITNSLTSILNEISIAANNSEVPIEDAKYGIIGYFDYETFAEQIDAIDGMSGIAKDHIIGIHVQYRYKTVGSEQGTAVSINGKFTYSDWNVMESFINHNEPVFVNGSYMAKRYNNENIKNEPHFNQIYIPISQGETVDIRLKVIFDMGYPFVTTMSSWSDIINIKFPDELKANIPILDIIDENNNDIENNRFNNMLINYGIMDHINNKIIDQDITYDHSPDRIASGFYTEERRVIPLKDKLADMDNMIAMLKSEIQGYSTDALEVYIDSGDSTSRIFPFQMNYVSTASYKAIYNNANESTTNGSYIYDKDTGIVSTIFNIRMVNISSMPIKIFSVFPGDRSKNIYDVASLSDIVNGYALDAEHGVRIYNKSDGSYAFQSANQFITFRIKDVTDNTPYYVKDEGEYKFTSTELPMNGNMSLFDVEDLEGGSSVYPVVNSKYDLCTDSNDRYSYKMINPKEEIVVPLAVEFKFKEDEMLLAKEYPKYISFDIRTSLYKDPINYTVKIAAKYMLLSLDKVTPPTSFTPNFSSIIKR